MIDGGDRIALPVGVTARDGALVDDVRGCVLPLNATGRAAIGASTPDEMAARLAQAYGVDRETARRDALRFCCDLNARALLNVDVGIARWFLAAFAMRGLPVPVVRRKPLATQTVCASLRTGVIAILWPVVGLCAVTSIACALALSLAGPVDLALVASLGVAGAAGVLVHELGHVVALRGVPACLLVRGLRVSVLHAACSEVRTKVVAACGPSSALVAAACALALLAVTRAPIVAPCVLLLAAHASGFTVATKDGRTLCAR